MSSHIVADTLNQIVERVAKSRRVPIYILTAITTFALGIIFSASMGLALPKLFPPPEIVEGLEVRVEENHNVDLVEPVALTFQDFGGTACGFYERGTPASWSTYLASDGVSISSELLLYETEKGALKKLRSLESDADRIIESRPITTFLNARIGELRLMERNGTFTLVTYFPGNESFNVRSLESDSLVHLQEFYRQEESLRRSFEVNRLNP